MLITGRMLKLLHLVDSMKFVSRNWWARFRHCGSSSSMVVLVLVLVVVVVIVFVVVVVVVVPTRCLSLVRILFWASRVVSEAQGGRELEEKRRRGLDRCTHTAAGNWTRYVINTDGGLAESTLSTWPALAQTMDAGDDNNADTDTMVVVGGGQ